MAWAIAFDTDNARCQASGITQPNALNQIRYFLETTKGYTNIQGSVYLSPAAGNAVTIVLDMQEFQRGHVWFKDVLSDLKMFRVEDSSNLLPAVL